MQPRGRVGKKFFFTGKGICDSATRAFVAAGLAAAFVTPALAGLAFNPTTFPEFMTWEYTQGSLWAVGVSNNLNGANDIHRQFQFGNGVPLDQSNNSPRSAVHGFAHAAVGTNRAWASAAVTTPRASAISNVISLWKDSFVISQDAEVTIRIHLDGNVPLVPAGVPLHYGSAMALYDFGVFRVPDDENMAEFYTLDQQNQLTTLDSSVWLNKDGRQVGGNLFNQDQQVRVGGTEIWNISLKPFLTAGEYEFRSMLNLDVATNEFTDFNVVDFSNTASFTGIAVPNGVSLSSSSGFLSETSPGVYGYRVAAVPEPTSIALVVAGLFAVGWAARAKRPVAPGH